VINLNSFSRFCNNHNKFDTTARNPHIQINQYSTCHKEQFLSNHNQFNQHKLTRKKNRKTYFFISSFSGRHRTAYTHSGFLTQPLEIYYYYCFFH
jgi:hypothetical protein